MPWPVIGLVVGVVVVKILVECFAKPETTRFESGDRQEYPWWRQVA